MIIKTLEENNALVISLAIKADEASAKAMAYMDLWYKTHWIFFLRRRNYWMQWQLLQAIAIALERYSKIIQSAGYVEFLVLEKEMD